MNKTLAYAGAQEVPKRYENPGNNSSGLCAAGREPVSSEILYQAKELAERAARLTDRVYGKLSPVMAPALPEPCNAGCQQREYPPLFEELRHQFQAIEGALSGIESAISRVEL